MAAPLFGQQAGSLDAGFQLAHSEGATVYSLSPQSDGKIIIGGYLPDEVAGVTNGPVTRVLYDGQKDLSFTPPGIESYNTLTDKIVTTLQSADIPEVFTTVIQSDGKILVGGSFFFVDSKPGYGGLIRLNSDGTLDTTFQAPRFNGTVFAVVPLSDGKFLVGGAFTYADDKKRSCVVRLDSAGKLDNGFANNAFSGTPPLKDDAIALVANVHSIVVQPNGDIIIGGAFTGIGSASRRGIARLGPNGSLDGSFVPDPGFNAPSTIAGQSPDYSLGQVFTLALQSNGDVVVGGSFRDPASPLLTRTVPTNSVYRLKTNGSLDPAFDPNGAGTVFVSSSVGTSDPFVSGIAIQPDGKIIIGGAFVGYNGVQEDLVARLNSNGTLDTGFDVGVGPTFSLYALALQGDAKLLIGGSFQRVDNVARKFVARLNTVADVPPAVVVKVAASEKTAYETGRVNGAFTLTRAGGNQIAGVQIQFTLSGTADLGGEYTVANVNVAQQTGKVLIPGGADSVVVNVEPTGKTLLHGNRKVTLTLVPTSAYGTTSKPQASVVITNAK